MSLNGVVSNEQPQCDQWTQSSPEQTLSSGQWAENARQANMRVENTTHLDDTYKQW